MFYFLLFLLAPLSRADSPFLEKILGDSDPTVFSAPPFTTDDYALEWKQPLPGVTARLLPGSLQWVRVDDQLIAPRALLELRSSAPGSVSVAGASQPFAGGGARVLMPLISSDRNEIIVRSEGRSGRLQVRFAPKKTGGDNIFFDTSCSRVRVSVAKNTLPADSWVYIGCRGSRNQAEGSIYNGLELLIFADNTGPLKTQGTEIPAADVDRWNFRLTSANRALELNAPKGSLVLDTGISEKARRAFLGAGIGPYVYKFKRGNSEVNATVPLATLYSAYTLTNTNRIVLFAAIAAQQQLYTDAGLYFQFESFRAFDRRISLNLLVGAHGFSYRHHGSTKGTLNFPQGFEFFFFDVFGRGNNASFGGFLQPPIDEKSYYNTWLRWGPASWFVEANYISITEPFFTIKTY